MRKKSLLLASSIGIGKKIIKKITQEIPDTRHAEYKHCPHCGASAVYYYLDKSEYTINCAICGELRVTCDCWESCRWMIWCFGLKKSIVAVQSINNESVITDKEGVDYAYSEKEFRFLPVHVQIKQEKKEKKENDHDDDLFNFAESEYSKC